MCSPLANGCRHLNYRSYFRDVINSDWEEVDVIIKKEKCFPWLGVQNADCIRFSELPNETIL
jgi:hypothetical protein